MSTAAFRQTLRRHARSLEPQQTIADEVRGTAREYGITLQSLYVRYTNAVTTCDPTLVRWYQTRIDCLVGLIQGKIDDNSVECNTAGRTLASHWLR